MRVQDFLGLWEEKSTAGMRTIASTNLTLPELLIYYLDGISCLSVGAI